MILRDKAEAQELYDEAKRQYDAAYDAFNEAANAGDFGAADIERITMDTASKVMAKATEAMGKFDERLPNVPRGYIW